ncbi:MAG: hypothetical protein GXY85_00760 [Candidatus Brocadiaceae bacterium]|nr:hypothetical protein [Candidatus Brocadiaceae bacterium]
MNLTRTHRPPSAGRRPSGRRLAVVGALLLALALSASAQEPPPGLVLPGDDLPYALVDGYRVDFTRNGALMVSRDGRALFDVGLVYARPEWKEWGTQIRRSGAEDGWHTPPGDVSTLIFHGTLHDVDGTPRFSYVQETKVLPNGLRVAYEVTPLARRVITTCGVTLHVPVDKAPDGHIDLWPGFGSTEMPETLGFWDVHSERARAADIAFGGTPHVSIAGDGTLDWQLRDYRFWHVNAYWLTGSDPELTRSLCRGETGSFAFEMRLGGASVQRATLDGPAAPDGATAPDGAAVCEVNAYGRAAVHAAGRKIAEGGLAWVEPRLEWLHRSASAAGAPPMGAVVESGGRPAVCRASLDADGTLRCTARAADGAAPAVHFALAVPVQEAPAEPTLGRDTPDGTHTATVVLKEGGVLTLRSQSPWSLRPTVIAGARCHVLSTPAETAGPEAAAQVRMAYVPAAPDTEGQAQ